MKQIQLVLLRKVKVRVRVRVRVRNSVENRYRVRDRVRDKVYIVHPNTLPSSS
jgi:hypothetical protein